MQSPRLAGSSVPAPWTFEDETIRIKLIDYVAASMASATAVERLVRELRPSLVLTEDTAYTPRGEILDICGQVGIPVIRWYTAHKASALMLKRYTSANRDHDINSLSDASWRIAREMDWSADRSEKLKRELSIGYARKDWYNEDWRAVQQAPIGYRYCSRQTWSRSSEKDSDHLSPCRVGCVLRPW